MLLFSVTPSKSSSYLLSIFRLHSFTFITVCHYQEDFVWRENKRFYSILFYSIIIRLHRCAVQCKIYYIENFFWYKCCRPYAAPPPLAASEWGPSSAGQWETSMLRRRNMDHPRCWYSQESGISGFRMPNAVDWRSIHHHYTGLGKRHTSCETVHDFWVRARVYIDTFLSDICLGLNTVYGMVWYGVG
jgi:hypothetical protein